MKKLTLLFVLISTAAFAQIEKPVPPTDTKQRVVEIDSVLYVEVIVRSYQRLSDQVLNQYDQLESAMQNHDSSKAQLREQQKEYERLLRQAVKSGYEPKNKFERGQYLRIIEKINKN